MPGPDLRAGRSRALSRGYLDDGCDGLVRASLTVGGQTLTAFGRIGVGPPAYAPDGLPVRTVADELEQALFGPEVEAGDVPGWSRPRRSSAAPSRRCG